MNSNPSDCVFCKIVSGGIPSSKVWEDDDFIAFLDIKPVHLGHALIVPKRHFTDLFAFDHETLSRLGPAVQKIAMAVKKATKADGINIMMNNGPAAGQVVFHAHVHIVPRFTGDGFEHWQGNNKYTDEQTAIAKKEIASYL